MNQLNKDLYKVDLFLLKLLPVIMVVSHIIASYGAIFQVAVCKFRINCSMVWSSIRAKVILSHNDDDFLSTNISSILKCRNHYQSTCTILVTFLIGKAKDFPLIIIDGYILRKWRSELRKLH